MQLAGVKLNGRVAKNDRCCGESGTFAMTRPDVAADSIVVEIARHVLGPQGLPEYVRAANNGGIERVLV